MADENALADHLRKAERDKKEGANPQERAARFVEQRDERIRENTGHFKAAPPRP